MAFRESQVEPVNQEPAQNDTNTLAAIAEDPDVHNIYEERSESGSSKS